MDLLLEIADQFVFDKMWATLLPLSAFTDPPTPISSPMATLNSTVPALTAVLRSIPHPKLPLNASVLALTSTTSAWPREYIPRQIASLTILTVIGIHLLYFVFATLSYYYIFNHDMMRHPKFLKNQVRMEIQSSLNAFPFITLLTLPWFQAEVMGYSMLYDDPKKYGMAYLLLSVPFYLVFTDYCIYWIHRWLHIPFFYKRLHKPHHKWLIPTPFASHAFHPVDGYLQSIPYHLFIFLFPLQRHLYLVLFVLVNFWSIFIHDSDMITGHPLENIINGPAHHTLHHLFFNCNYGQYFTWADRAGGSYRHPKAELDPMLEILARDKAALSKSKSKGPKEA